MPYKNDVDKIASDRARHFRNRSKNLNYFKEYAKRPEAKTRWFELHLKRHYGLTTHEFNRLNDLQKGCCAICGKENWTQKSGRLCVDHDHDTGKVRGLLCQQCNVGLGSFEDSPSFLEGAIAYLRRTV